MSADSTREVDVLRIAHAMARSARDRVAHEAPLEIQLAGAPLAVLMRTPGHDHQIQAQLVHIFGALIRWKNF